MTVAQVLCAQIACVIVADMRKNTKNIAFSAVFTALSVVLLLLSSALPNMSLSILAVAGVVSALALSECGYRYTLLMYLATCVISAIFVPDKSCVILYVLLFGHYPMLRTIIGRVGKAWLCLIIKLAAANILAFAVLYITLSFFENVGHVIIMGRKYFFLFYNLAVILYDVFIGKCMYFYTSKRFSGSRFD